MKILITDGLLDIGIKILKEKGFEVDVRNKTLPQDLKKLISDYEGVIVKRATKITREIIDLGKKLKVIGRPGSGLDNIDVNYAKQRGIAVINTPSGCAPAVAELTFCLIISLVRHVHKAIYLVKEEGIWDKTLFEGNEIYDKTLGVVGCGNIGRIVTRLGVAFNMKVLVYDPYIPEELVHRLGAFYVSFNELLTQSDIVTLHVPLTEETYHMFHKEIFYKMKKGAFLINTSRGEVINEKDLYNVLLDGHLQGVGLDVLEEEPINYNNPLRKLNNVIITPHIGASSIEAQNKINIEVAEKVSQYLLSN